MDRVSLPSENTLNWKKKSSMKSKHKSLKSARRGNQPMHSDILTSEELDKFYRLKQLWPRYATSVLNTLWFNNTVHLGMRGGVTEHRSLCWGDITLKTENNLEYVQLNERQTKIRDGANPRYVRRCGHLPKIQKGALLLCTNYCFEKSDPLAVVNLTPLSTLVS